MFIQLGIGGEDHLHNLEPWGQACHWRHDHWR
jgi:hypothetical protein